MALVPTTELEAVNAILATVGESPVDSLSTGFVDAELANDLLNQVSKQVQLSGWSFNTEFEYTLSPDVDGYLNLPINTLRVIVPGERTYVQRGSRLYDNTNHTYVFTEDVTVDLVVALDYEELPEALRQFIMIRAARRFQDGMEADAVLHKFSTQDEIGAWANFLNFEAQTGQYNVVQQSQTVINIKGVNR